MYIINNKSILERSLRRNPSLNIYQLGDLDDFFWKYTTWYGDDPQDPHNVILVYAGVNPPTILALSNDIEGMTKLLKTVKPHLPGIFFCHLSPGLIHLFDKNEIIEDWKLHYKMTAKGLNTNIQIDKNKIRQLLPNDYEVIKNFYAISYPGNWFDKRMLETGMYYGYFENGELVGIAGIHVYSPEYKVAALGNITTHPEYRNKGISTQVTYKLCKELFKTVDTVSLNVITDNDAAIRCYKKIGFEITAEYEEYYLRNNK